MKKTTLIANSGIQYLKFSTDIDKDFGKRPENILYYRDSFNTHTDEYVLDPLFKYTKEGDTVYYRWQQLQEGDFVANGRIKEDMDRSGLQEFIDAYQERDLIKALKKFQRNWIPLPYFKDNGINKDVLYPTDWVRVFIDCEETEEGFTSAKIILAVDTLLAQNASDKTSPELSLN